MFRRIPPPPQKKKHLYDPVYPPPPTLPPLPPSRNKQSLGHAYLPAAILVLAGSLARPSSPSSMPQPETTEGGEGSTSPVYHYQPETKVAFYKKVGGNASGLAFSVPLDCTAVLSSCTAVVWCGVSGLVVWKAHKVSQVVVVVVATCSLLSNDHPANTKARMPSSDADLR